jgi:hypothetical protein
MSSKYSGLAFEVKKRMSDNWQANFGITFEVGGRLGSSSARSLPTSTQTSTAGVFGQNPNDFINTDGRLQSDRPVVIKAQFIYQLPWQMLTSFNFQSQSGKPIYENLRVGSSETDIPGTSNILANVSDGDLRTPQWTTLDARVEKAFALGGTAELAVFGDFLNLFNSDTTEASDQPHVTDNYLVPSRFIRRAG